MNESILQRIASGDRGAVDDCLDRYGGLVWGLARRWISNQADAEDATQEIFLELWQKAGRFQPELSGEATFVSMIARRRLIDRRRRETRSIPTEAAEVTTLADVSEIPDTAVERGDEADKAKQCLSKLSSVQQKILTAVIHFGSPHTLIAEQLAIPLGTVKSHARRGLIQIRDCMKLNQAGSISQQGMKLGDAVNEGRSQS